MAKNLPKWSEDTLNWLIKFGIGSICFAVLFWLGSSNNVLMADVVTDISHIQLIPILLVEVLDKFSDGTLFKNIFQKVKGGRAWALSLILGFGAFYVICAVISGSILLSSGVLGMSTVIAAGLVTLYVVAPETGDAELLLYVWIGATIATGFANFGFMPPIPGLVYPAIDLSFLNPFSYF